MLGSISTAKILWFSLELHNIMHENYIIVLPFNNSRVWCASFLGCMTHYESQIVCCPYNWLGNGFKKLLQNCSIRIMNQQVANNQSLPAYKFNIGTLAFYSHIIQVVFGLRFAHVGIEILVMFNQNWNFVILN